MHDRRHERSFRRVAAVRWGWRFVLTGALAAVVGCGSSNRPWIANQGPVLPALPLLDSTLTQPSTHPLASAALASNDRDWSPEQAVTARAEFKGDEVTIRNIRDFRYETADTYTVNYYDQTLAMEDLATVDFIVVPFPEAPNMAHTMLSFGFDGNQYIAVSVEARREKGETYDPVKGILGQYELMYVVGSERDLIGLRANHWQNDVYVYHAKATQAQARTLFRDVFHRVNQLAEQPELYNTLTNNCTTNLAAHVNRLAPQRVPLDYRVWINGYSDRLAYDLGLIEAGTTFDETRQRARVNYQAYLHRDSPDFSAAIRR